jgi:H/ACA ribonucleoprotein complex subunit 3
VLVGAVLPGLTRFWVGPRFGLGFYEAGELRVGFVLRAEAAGIDDRIDLPRWPGALVDAHAVVSATAGFLAWTSRHAGRLHRGVARIRPEGRVDATAAAPEDALPWLSTAPRGCAVDDALFCPTDEGVVPVRAAGDRLVAGPPLPGTAEPVNASHTLLALPEGIAVVSPNEIRLLQWR